MGGRWSTIAVLQDRGRLMRRERWAERLEPNQPKARTEVPSRGPHRRPVANREETFWDRDTNRPLRETSPHLRETSPDRGRPNRESCAAQFLHLPAFRLPNCYLRGGDSADQPTCQDLSKHPEPSDGVH